MAPKHRPADLNLPTPIASFRRSSSDRSASSPLTPSYSPSSPYFAPSSPHSPSLRSPTSARISPGYPYTPPGTPNLSRPNLPFGDDKEGGKAGKNQVWLSPLSPGVGAGRKGLMLVQKRSKRGFLVLCMLLVFGWLFMSGWASGERAGETGLLGAAREKLWHASEDSLYHTLQARPPKPLIHSRPRPTSSLDSTSSAQFTTPSQELAALILFLSSAETNHLPLELSPLSPLPPDSVLEETLPANALEQKEVLGRMEQECWEATPVVVVGKAGEVWTAESKEILRREEYIGRRGEGLMEVFVDKRVDSDVLEPLISRLLASAPIHPSLASSSFSDPKDIFLPQILIAGARIGSFDDLKALHDSGALFPLLEDAGMRVGFELRERIERERKAVLMAKHGKMKRLRQK